MEKVIVTGGAGFIGSHLVDALIERGNEVHVIDTFAAGRKEERMNAHAQYHNADITRIREIGPLFEGVRYVFHLAALPRVQYSIEHEQETNLVNLGGTMNVLKAAHNARAKRVVFAASSSAYGDQERMPLSENMPVKPMSPYAMQKYLSEEWCAAYATDHQYKENEYRLETVSLRFFNVYGLRLDPEGPYALVIGKFLKQRREGADLTVTGDGTQTRDFTHVRDVVAAVLLAAASSRVGNGEVINIGGGHNVTINELARMFGTRIRYIEPRVEPHDTLADIGRAHSLLGWRPQVPLEEGIKELLISNS